MWCLVLAGWPLSLFGLLWWWVLCCLLFVLAVLLGPVSSWLVCSGAGLLAPSPFFPLCAVLRRAGVLGFFRAVVGVVLVWFSACFAGPPLSSPFLSWCCAVRRWRVSVCAWCLVLAGWFLFFLVVVVLGVFFVGVCVCCAVWFFIVLAGLVWCWLVSPPHPRPFSSWCCAVRGWCFQVCPRGAWCLVLVCLCFFLGLFSFWVLCVVFFVCVVSFGPLFCWLVWCGAGWLVPLLPPPICFCLLFRAVVVCGVARVVFGAGWPVFFVVGSLRCLVLCWLVLVFAVSFGLVLWQLVWCGAGLRAPPHPAPLLFLVLCLAVLVSSGVSMWCLVLVGWFSLSSVPGGAGCCVFWFLCLLCCFVRCCVGWLGAVVVGWSPSPPFLFFFVLCRAVLVWSGVFPWCPVLGAGWLVFIAVGSLWCWVLWLLVVVLVMVCGLFLVVAGLVCGPFVGVFGVLSGAAQCGAVLVGPGCAGLVLAGVLWVLVGLLVVGWSGSVCCGPCWPVLVSVCVGSCWFGLVLVGLLFCRVFGGLWLGAALWWLSGCCGGWSAVLVGVLSFYCAVWCGVPKALLPKGKGRDVYPRVKVNGLGCVCCVRAVCKCVVA